MPTHRSVEVPSVAVLALTSHEEFLMSHCEPQVDVRNS
jgi:hypothetical protein